MEAANPAQARRVGKVVVAVLLILTGWLAVSTSMCGNQADLRLAAGYAAMHQGQWRAACEDFREAASASLLRDEAVFALHTCERVLANDGLTPFEQAVRAADWEAAKSVKAETDARTKLQVTFASAVQNAR